MEFKEHKNRFYTLLESELGNVKPLISEQAKTPPDYYSYEYWHKPKPKEEGPPKLKNLPNISRGSRPETLKLCPPPSPYGINSPYSCIEREVKVCYSKFCFGLEIDFAKVDPYKGDLRVKVRPKNKAIQGIIDMLPKKWTDEFLNPNGQIEFVGDARGVNYGVQQIKQGNRNVQVPLGYGVYALFI